MKTDAKRKFVYMLVGFVLLTFTMSYSREGRPFAPSSERAGLNDSLPFSIIPADHLYPFQDPIIISEDDDLDDDDLLERESEDDCRQYDAEWIEAEEGGELEVGENEIEIPEGALKEDTWMALYIPYSNYIEYWIYPPSLSFSDTVEVTFSYDNADLGLVDEGNISIAQWIPQFNGWQNVGGVVDTLENQVTTRITILPPPFNIQSRFALADHN